MKHIITKVFLLLLLAVAGTAKAQDKTEKEHTWEKLPLENTAWVHYYKSLTMNDSMFFQLGIKGDTIVNSMNYKKVIYCSHFCFPIEGKCFGGIRQDEDGKCYFFPFGISYIGPLFLNLIDQTDYLLYDFSLEECDIFPFPEGFGRPGTVFLTEETVINDMNRKVIWFDDNCEQGPHYYDHKWIEGVGCNFGLLFSIQSIPLNAPVYKLVEILQDGEIIYTAPEFVGIDYTSVSENASPNETVRLYPNPFTESGTLDFGQLNADELTIMTLDGRIVRKENVKGMSSFNIEKRDLDSGLYFYRLSGENLKTVVGKMCIK